MLIFPLIWLTLLVVVGGRLTEARVCEVMVQHDFKHTPTNDNIHRNLFKEKQRNETQ